MVVWSDSLALCMHMHIGYDKLLAQHVDMMLKICSLNNGVGIEGQKVCKQGKGQKNSAYKCY